MIVSSKNHINGINGLRAISILMVLANHSGITDFLLHTYWGGRFWLLINGEAGVSFFFLISGFLITHLLILEKENTGRIHFQNFLIRRFLRLMPPLWSFYLVWGILVLTGVLHSNSIAFVFSFFYLYNFLPQKFNVVELTHTWSLAVEEQFYFIWPLVFQRFRSMVNFRTILLTMLICVAAAGVFMYLSVPLGGENITLSNAFRPMRWFIPAVYPILMGIAMALHFSAGIKNSGLLLISITGILPVFLLPEEWIFMVYFTLPLFFGALLWKVVHKADCKLVLFLENPFLETIGRWSYSLYIWQGLFLTTGVGSVIDFQVYPLNLVLTFVFAILSYYIIEQPIQKWRAKYR